MKEWKKILGTNEILFIISVVISVMYCAISVAVPVVSGKITDQLLSRSSDEISGTILAFLGICILEFCFLILNQILQKKVTRRVKGNLRCQAFGSYSNKKNLNRDQISGFTSFINNEIPCIVEQYVLGILDIVSCISLLVFTSMALVQVHPMIAGMIIIVSILIVCVPKVMRNKAAEAREEYAKAQAVYQTNMESYLRGVHILRAYEYCKRANQLLEKKNVQVRKKEKNLAKYQIEVQSLTAILQIMKTFFVFVCGIYLINHGRMNFGGLIVAVQLAGNIGAPIEVLAMTLHARNESKPLVKKYMEMLNQEERISEKAEDLVIHNMEMKDVSYAIGNTFILNHVSQKFEMGKNYMICGKSGSGKSVFLKVLSRMQTGEYAGEIFINDKNIKNISCNSFYHEVAVVFQEPYLFWGTLEENILLGRTIEKEKFQEVIQKLDLEYLLERYKGQEINRDNIDVLSGGEKQRIALARAMMMDPQVYLLDEVTSALDREHSYEIEKLLLQEKAMVIHVCHKPIEALENMYDEIINIDFLQKKEHVNG